MKNQVTCPVCQNSRELPEGADGRKWKCGGCTSIHRIILGEHGYELKTLEEAMPVASAPAEHEATAEAGAGFGKAPVGPKLQTRRSKMRDEGVGAPGSSRRTTRGSSRRGR